MPAQAVKKTAVALVVTKGSWHPAIFAPIGGDFDLFANSIAAMTDGVFHNGLPTSKKARTMPGLFHLRPD